MPRTQSGPFLPKVEKIRELRKSKGLSQEDLARSAGISVEYLRKLEQKKKSNPSWTVVHKLCTALGVDLHQIFTPDEAMNSRAIQILSDHIQLEQEKAKARQAGFREGYEAGLRVVQAELTHLFSVVIDELRRLDDQSSPPSN